MLSSSLGKSVDVMAAGDINIYPEDRKREEAPPPPPSKGGWKNYVATALAAGALGSLPAAYLLGKGPPEAQVIEKDFEVDVEVLPPLTTEEENDGDVL